MKFETPLTAGRLIRRYKRFLADVELPDGSVESVHCPNPGAMLGLDQPGSECRVSLSKNPNRKLPYTLELVKADGTWVGINTSLPNRLAEEAIANRTIEELGGYRTMKREVRYGVNSRIDFLLQDEARPDCYVEVKNVHLRRRQGLVEFPDCVTKRGAKHLVELSDMVSQGHRAVMLFIVQRGDGDSFAIARDLDPGYGTAFDDARLAGIEVLVYACAVDPSEIQVTTAVDLVD